MSNPNPYYLHFVTDLKRVVFCLLNKNTSGAQTFMEHANTIYESKLKTDSVFAVVAQNFDTVWDTLYHTALTGDEREQKEFTEQILTLSSIVMLRSMHIHKIKSLANKLDVPATN